MGLLDILKQYADPAGAPAGQVKDHFDQVTQQAAPQAVGSGIAAAFRSDATPEFGQMVGDLFNNSNPQQKAGVLNQLVQALGTSQMAGGVGNMLQSILGAGASTKTISADQAAKVSATDVAQAAAQAQQQDGSIIDKLGAFYAQHPALVQTLGATALSIAMSHMHRNQ